MDPGQGIVCSLTGKIANFDPDCSNFEKDENEIYRMENRLYIGNRELGEKSTSTIWPAVILFLILVRYLFVYNLM